MRPRRWSVAAVVIVAMLTHGRAMAQDAAADPTNLTPLEVLADAFDAVEAGEFHRYVDHLTAHEQRIQAGYVLYTVVAMNELLRSDASKPEILLMTQGLRDVAIDHLTPRGGQPGNPTPADETPEMLVRNLLTSLFVQPVGPTPAVPQYAPVPQYETQPTSFDQICLKASGLLKDPRKFLIDALQELSLATEVSGAEPGRPVESIDLAAHARSYQQVKWTLFTRGDRALAVPKVAQAENPPAADTKPGKPAKANPPSPAPSGDDSETFRIEFRKLDGRWKIASLLPVAQMQAGFQFAPNKAQSVPYPAEWK